MSVAAKWKIPKANVNNFFIQYTFFPSIPIVNFTVCVFMLSFISKLKGLLQN